MGHAAAPLVQTTFSNMAGADPEIEEGRGIHIEWRLVWRAKDAVVHARASLVPLHAFVAYSTSLKSPRTRPCIYSMHSLVGGSGGMLPQENLDHVKVLLRPLENICGYWSVNSGDSSYCRFSESLLFGTSPFFKALPQNCLFNLGAADLSALCMQDMKQCVI